MQNVTLSGLMALLPVVANQDWFTDNWNMIRNRRGQCPICAIAEELDPRVNGFTDDAPTALAILMRRSLTDNEHIAISRFIKAADADLDGDVNMRERMLDVLRVVELEGEFA